MAKYLENKTEKILAKLETNEELSLGKTKSMNINTSISKVLLSAKKKIERNQRESRLEASKLTLT